MSFALRFAGSAVRPTVVRSFFTNTPVKKPPICQFSYSNGSGSGKSEFPFTQNGILSIYQSQLYSTDSDPNIRFEKSDSGVNLLAELLKKCGIEPPETDVTKSFSKVSFFSVGEQSPLFKSIAKNAGIRFVPGELEGLQQRFAQLRAIMFNLYCTKEDTYSGLVGTNGAAKVLVMLGNNTRAHAPKHTLPIEDHCILAAKQGATVSANNNPLIRPLLGEHVAQIIKDLTDPQVIQSILFVHDIGKYLPGLREKNGNWELTFGRHDSDGAQMIRDGIIPFPGLDSRQIEFVAKIVELHSVKALQKPLGELAANFGKAVNKDIFQETRVEIGRFLKDSNLDFEETVALAVTYMADSLSKGYLLPFDHMKGILNGKRVDIGQIAEGLRARYLQEDPHGDSKVGVDDENRMLGQAKVAVQAAFVIKVASEMILIAKQIEAEKQRSMGIVR